MKYLYHFTMLCSVMLASLQTGIAQNTGTPTYPEVSFNGMVRFRIESDGRFFDFNAKPLLIDLLKTQIGATVKISPDITLFTKLQDSRNFGEGDATQARGTLDGMAKNFGLREGAVQWNNFLTDGLTVKFGRMIFSTNNERLIGALDWHNVGRSYDGNVISYKAGDKTQFRAFAFKLGHDELTMTQAKGQLPQALLGADIDLPWQDKLNLYFYHDRNAALLMRGPDGGKTQLERSSIGVYIKNTISNIEYEVEITHQLGSRKKTDSTARADINANMVTTYVSYKVQNNLSIGAGCDYYTGDDPTTATTNESFDHLFTTIHKFYGYMDFFPSTVLPVTGQRKALAVTNAGLLMPYLKSLYNYDEKLSFQLWAMMFNAQQTLAATTSKNLGIEVDINAYYKFLKNVKVEAGFCTFLPGEAVKVTNPSVGMGTDAAYWGYLMLTLDW
ncbi:MAG: alginate export family protein [Candidatus Kapabacteria bacterium]|nr:alginate export family protein [Candidatus Kapabacteria bacterium]